MKACSKCQEVKPLSEYYGNKKASDGKASECKSCSKARQKAYYDANPDARKQYTIKTRLKTHYGITPEDRARMLEEAEHKCQICKDDIYLPDTSNKNSNANIDHCHDTGRVRGVLCGPCNRALGLFKDNPAIIMAAHSYLSLHK